MSYDNWKEVNFSELGRIVTGKTPKTKIDRFWNGTIPFITPKDIQVNKYVHSTERYITEDGLATVSSQLLPKKSICVSCIGNIGYVGFTNNESISNQQINSIIPNEEYDSDYVYYLMKNSWPIFKSLENQSTTVSILNKSHFSALKVRVTKNNVKQKAIANILSSLDDKIEINNKINKKLEEIAQALYKQWFVDFEFPNEDGEPYKSSGGEMIERDQGLIPKDWDILKLSDAIDFIRGIEPGSKNYLEQPTYGSVPFYRVGDLLNDKHVNVHSGLCKGKFVDFKDILMSFDGSVGRVSIGLEGSFSTGLRKISWKDNKPRYSYTYYMLKSDNIQKTVNEHSTGTTIMHAGSSIEYLMVPFNNEIARLYEKTIEPFFTKLLEIKKENKNLSETRDLLLPKLMSGEIEVPIKEGSK